MAQFFAALLVVAAAMLAFKAAVLLLFLAGLIFRPSATVGLIAVLGVLALVRDYTVWCAVVAAAIALFSLHQHRAGG